ncbi:fat storage-inducing transmembrane protein 2 isoform X1 [Scyliorhinus canicula]|uniref:fat storage-inducing transmembrane protein 2 isoform X1 n=1 Tax=Scyliorhinus canicula TaxID=7830 RepID=UPI0018F45F3D|nr:fat storage-inducing transmembrane protein 2 isoform X1 [Scyliorhinus canicula]
MSVDALVQQLSALHRACIRPYLAPLLTLITLGGSLLKASQLVTESYFSNRRNALNVYFVKFSWGWTLGLLLPFVFTSNYFVQRDVLFAVRRITSCVVGTAVWFFSTRLFHVIENFTGECYESQNVTVLHEFENLYTCRKHGHLWLGFDISGHSFLLSYCVLIIAEEIAVVNELHKVEQKRGKATATIIKSLFIALNALLLLWVWMFFCTAIYFHDMPHKIIGTAFGISAWYGTYRFWFKKSFSPGLPPEIGKQKV